MVGLNSSLTGSHIHKLFILAAGQKFWVSGVGAALLENPPISLPAAHPSVNTKSFQVRPSFFPLQLHLVQKKGLQISLPQLLLPRFLRWCLLALIL